MPEKSINENILKRAIVKTLVYSDVFDYPLTLDEIWCFLIVDLPEQKQDKIFFPKILKYYLSKNSFIIKKNNYYCFKDRKNIIGERLKKEKESKNKFKIAKEVVSHLKLIPTIKLIGVSGALSMKNAEQKDDIDLFIICRKNTLWLTRLFSLILLEILGKRRRRFDNNFRNKICLNLLIDEDKLCLPKEKQDLYNAHEVIQMIPVFNKSNTYNKFISENLWISKFLPNSVNFNKLRYKDSKINPTKIFDTLFFILETIAYKIQFFYMRKHIKNEIITNQMLAFHPLDYKKVALSSYKLRLKKYGKL